MIQIAEHLTAPPSRLWTLMKQAGVEHAVGTLPAAGSDGAPWGLGPLTEHKKLYEKAGFEVAVIEHSSPIDKIMIGHPARDEQIEWFCELLRSMGRLEIPVLCYNFMAVFNWVRTSVETPSRGGALVTTFNLAELEEAPVSEGPSEEQLWDYLEYFLRRVVPVAEDAGVKLAMHPDDPPLSPVRGVGRIMSSVDNFQRLVELVPSDVNGITLCQGNFALMTDDLPATIRRFGEQGKIHFVHFRDVRGTAENFSETFHDEGPTDMLACMRAYRDIGFEGVLRSDHVPTLDGDSNDLPGYSTLGRLHAVGYIQGLREAAYAN